MAAGAQPDAGEARRGCEAGRVRPRYGLTGACWGPTDPPAPHDLSVRPRLQRDPTAEESSASSRGEPGL